MIYHKYKESIVQILKDQCKWKGGGDYRGESDGRSYPSGGKHTAEDKSIEFHGIFEGEKCVDDL